MLPCMSEPLITLDFQCLEENRLQCHAGRPLPSPTHSQRISPLSFYDTGWLLTPQIPQDWLGLEIKHCLPIIKMISYNINAHKFLFVQYNMKHLLSSFLLILSCKIWEETLSLAKRGFFSLKGEKKSLKWVCWSLKTSSKPKFFFWDLTLLGSLHSFIN